METVSQPSNGKPAITRRPRGGNQERGEERDSFLHIRCSKNLRQRVKIAAATEDRDMNDVCIEALEQYMEGKAA